MPTNKKLLILAGDGIGPEVMTQVKRVLDWFAKNQALSFDVEDDLVGGCAIDKHGVPLTDETMAKAMKAGGGGSIVLIGSQSMFKPSLPQAGYAASKGALLTTMYYLADELGAHAIRCNMVVPSWMWGPSVQMYVGMQTQGTGKPEEEVVQEIVGDFPLQRMTEDGEVADVVMFFASDLSKAVTGQHLMVNCGELMR